MVILVLVGLVAIWWTVRLYQVARRYRLPKTPNLPDELPSVSVCIPARNEIHALSECLERVLASDYPKLEILVLDDNSADDTSVIIRSFAHAGVRFVAGKPLPDGWLGKNFALETLTNESSGTYILYMDVDTKLEVTSISSMVNVAMANGVSMLSVIPDRYDMARSSVYVGSLRYFWELLLSTRACPPSSSAAWLINREFFVHKMGSFADVRISVRPEAVIAARVSKESLYQAVIHSHTLGIGYEKRWSSVTETSRRLLYQIVGGTWFMGIGALTWLGLLNVPTFVLVSSIVTSWHVIDTVALVSLLLLVGMYGLYLHYTWKMRWWIGMWLWPYVIVQEFVLFALSMVGYTTHTITWKGRAIERTRLDTSTTF